jgi:murein DD-endopeptidase MepM/ murein hydrolase activator NlpD
VVLEEASLEAPVARVEQAVLDAERTGAEARSAAEWAVTAGQRSAAEDAALADAQQRQRGAQAALDRHQASLAGAAVAWYVNGAAPVDLADELLVPDARTARARAEVATDAAMEAVLDAVGGARAAAQASRRAVDEAAARAAAASSETARAHTEATASAARAATAAADLVARRGELEAADVLADPIVAEIGATGGATFPVAGSWEFLDSWGDPRSGGRRHRGSDVWAAEGTPLVAIESGVARADADPLGGLTVWLDGDSGARYYYAHLATVHENVAAAGAGGRRVAVGEVVGSVGSTGNASGGPAHLHIQIAPDGGDWANPYPTLAALSVAVTTARAALAGTPAA